MGVKMNYFGLAAILSAATLAACGGGETTDPGSTIPPEVALGSFPANSVSSSSEVGVGSFQASFAQSVKDFSGSRRPGRAELSTGKVTLYSTAGGEMVVVLGSGVEYVFKEASQSTRADGNIDYVYAEKDKPTSTNSLLIRRGLNGARYGYFLIDPVGTVSPTRATFHYGWKTPPASMPSTGMATYSSPEGGQLYTTDGRRIFGRPTSIDVDFANNRLSGDLFDNTGTPDFHLEAKVSVNNVPIDANGAFSAGTVTATFTDSLDPISTTGTVTGTAEGQFYGPAADALTGIFEGSVPITQPSAGASTFGFNGVFSALKP